MYIWFLVLIKRAGKRTKWIHDVVGRSSSFNGFSIHCFVLYLSPSLHRAQRTVVQSAHEPRRFEIDRYYRHHCHHIHCTTSQLNVVGAHFLFIFHREWTFKCEPCFKELFYHFLNYTLLFTSSRPLFSLFFAHTIRDCFANRAFSKWLHKKLVK